MPRLTKTQAAEQAALVAAVETATAAHRADREALKHDGRTVHDAALFAAVRDATNALAEWRAANLPQRGRVPSRFLGRVEQRVRAERDAEAREVARREAAAKARKGGA